MILNFRREAGNCRICWTTASDSDFQVSGRIDAARGITKVRKKILEGGTKKYITTHLLTISSVFNPQKRAAHGRLDNFISFPTVCVHFFYH